ncbi:MAG: selenide, water dikinase SelD [Bacteroidota bacterium]
MNTQPSDTLTDIPTPTKPSPVKLTQYSHGAGCGCKISPKVLDTILSQGKASLPHPNLLIGNEDRDDAAAYDLGDGTAILSTTDFFMPIVDDAFDFGRIASVNALSDIYAMGGTPLMSIAILGWPVDKIPAEVAGRVLEGARHVCREAGIPLAGGHSIDSPEPIFGLAVTGRVAIDRLKRNGGAKVGDKLYLTKRLGVGILSTAQKKGQLDPDHGALALKSMTTLNQVGERLSRHSFVHAMTDVTGFGLLGHLSEMCESSGLTAEIQFEKVPSFSVLPSYIRNKNIPGGTQRNYDSYHHKICPITEEQKHILCDPQTSGGLLIAVDPAFEATFKEITSEFGLRLQSFGFMIEKGKHMVEVK